MESQLPSPRNRRAPRATGAGCMNLLAECSTPTAGLARAFASADMPPEMPVSWPPAAQRAFNAAAWAVRSLAPSAEPPVDHAWFALRAALAMEDAEMLAAADLLAGRAGSGWAAQSVVALVARARSDSQTESKCFASFLVAAEPLPDGPQAAAAILAAASLLEGATFRTADTAALAGWAVQRLDRLVLAASSAEPDPCLAEQLLAYLELSLAKTGAVPVRADLPARLRAIRETHASDVWLWSLAHDVFADDRFKALALAARLPSRPLWRGLALLRLHQLTGDTRWVVKANRVVARAPNARLPNGTPRSSWPS